jgi:hypothetical protein
MSGGANVFFFKAQASSQRAAATAAERPAVSQADCAQSKINYFSNKKCIINLHIIFFSLLQQIFSFHFSSNLRRKARRYEGEIDHRAGALFAPFRPHPRYVCCCGLPHRQRGPARNANQKIVNSMDNSICAALQVARSLRATKSAPTALHLKYDEWLMAFMCVCVWLCYVVCLTRAWPCCR